MRKQKDNYLTHWKEFTKKQDKLECYLALNREYTVAEYLTTVTDTNLRKALTMYRLSEHSLAIEKGGRRQTWLSREDRCHDVGLGLVYDSHKYLSPLFPLSLPY